MYLRKCFLFVDEMSKRYYNLIMEIINVKTTADCPFVSGGNWDCLNIDGPEFCGSKIPKDCPLIESDYLIHLVKDRVVV